MDFQNILSLAAQNSSSKQVKRNYSAQLGPPVKEKKEKEKSEVVKKLIEEKEREKREAEEARERIKRKIKEAEERRKREKDLKTQREKEEKERREKEEERKNRFRIPKKGENALVSDKIEIKSTTSSASNSPSSVYSVKRSSSSKRHESDSKKHETDSKRHRSEKKDSKPEHKGSSTSSKNTCEKIDPTTVKPTALSSHQRNSHLYDDIEKKRKSNETEIERKRREFEEKRARLLQQMKTKGLEKEKPVIVKKTEKSKSNKDSDRKSEKKSKSEKQSDREKMSEKPSLPNSKPGAISAKQDSSNSKISVSEKVKSINNGKKMPPPLGFNDLLKLAQVKASEPVTMESVKKPEKKDSERLMTKEERERFMEEQACRQRKSSSVSGKSQSLGENPKSASHRENSDRYSKHSRDKLVRDNREENSSPKLKGLLTNGVQSNSSVSSKVNSSEKSPLKRKSDMSSIPSSSKMISNSKSTSSLSRSADHLDAKKRRLDSPSTSRPSSSGAGRSVTGPNSAASRSSGPPSKQRQRPYDSENENVLVCGPPKTKPEAALNPFDRIYGQIKKNHPKPEMKRRRIESDNEEDEYDEEMEGFITDEGSDLEEDYPQDMDYSKHIRQIFGYDKRKYKYESDRDIANMESNFAQQMKEEARSARLGLQEDLEDIRREEEELKRKMERKRKN